eukprot:scaffold82780_cov60-Phaeocystis_antarctica.AAC.2
MTDEGCEGGRADFLVGEGGGGSAVTAMRGGNSCARRCSAGGGRGGAQARASCKEMCNGKLSSSTCPCEWNCHLGWITRERSAGSRIPVKTHLELDRPAACSAPGYQEDAFI